MATKKRKLNKRFFILLALAALVVVGIVAYKFLAPERGRLKATSFDMQLTTVSVIIREEVPVTVGDYSEIRFLVREGDYVYDNQQIADLYARGYETQLSQIVTLEQTIYQQQLTLLKLQTDGDTLPPTLTEFNDRIQEMIARMTEVTEVISGEDYLTLEEDLAEILKARRDLLSQLVTADTALINNMNQLYALEAAFAQRTPLLNTGSAGYISFFIDGYEDALVIDQLTSAQIRRILASPTSNTYNDSALYRIVATDHFYIAMSAKADSAARLSNGETYHVTLNGEGTEYECTVVAERLSATYAVYVLEVNADVRPVLNGRTATFTFEKQVSGVSVPADMLYYIDGVPMLDIKSGSDYIPVAVSIIGYNEEEDIAVIKAQNSAITLTAGLKYQENKDAEDANDEETPEDTASPSTSPSAGTDSAAPTPFAVP